MLISSSTWKKGELSVTFRPPFDIILHGVLQARTATEHLISHFSFSGCGACDVKRC
ncbi:MAG: hypothetical protein M3076_16305 [Actinomycetota bacterium]|nr:hypothetical protein [Actinomycetota bacterium]